MRVAILSDIHGNLTALEAVLADLRHTAPDLILHGGDLPHGGSNPAGVVDQIRDLGWPGVLGNTDEMLFAPETLTNFAARAPQLKTMFDAIGEMAAWTRDALSDAQVAWLRELPRKQVYGSIALVHASPESAWQAPNADGLDEKLREVYAPLGQPIAVYGHIHTAYVRTMTGLTVINTGGVSLAYDGDPRAAYLLLDDSAAQIRRVEYDVEREVQAMAQCGLPHSDWVAKMLRTARPAML